jgi:P4 family phage/plasmid primase-like protien
MGDAYTEAQRLRDVHTLYCAPVRVEGEGASKRVLPLGEWSVYLNGKDPDEAFAELWDQNTDAPALAIVCGRRFGVIALDADTPEAETYVLERRVPRTPAWRSARGPHWLFRPGDCELTSTSGLVPGLDLLAESKLALIPPTRGRTWLPSASIDDVPIALVPDWLVTQAKVKRPRVAVVPGRELPPGEAHERMVSILGRLGRVLSGKELPAVAARLNEGRLPSEELAKIVDHVLEKEGDAGRYFDRKEGFLPAILAEEIAEAYGIRRGVGGHLYHYRDGVHRFDGRERVEQVCRRVLGERFKPRHAREVVDVLRAGHQEIPDEPNPDLLNVANGMLDWRTADLFPHAPEHLSIIQLPVAWNPDATCPAIDVFLSEVLPADAQRFAREAIGYTAVAEAFLRQAFMLLGSGSNGKSTFLSVLRRLLGRRNVSAVPLQAFGESRFAAAEVHGKLANVCGDLDSRALRRSDLFKTLTGGTDAVMAERKYEHPFSFVPYATLLFSANEAPASSDQSDAYFDRWVILPFDRRFEGADVDPHLLEKLTTREELEGLLVQAVSGLMDLAERGRFDLPPSVRAAIEEYRAKIDTVATFLEEACELDVKFSVPRSRLYEQYREWCVRNGRMAVSQQSFAPRVRAHLRAEIAAGRVEEGKSHADRVWRGIAPRD